MTPPQIDEYYVQNVAHQYRGRMRQTLRPVEAARWYTTLAPYTTDEALEALRDWRRYHHDDPPTLDELVRRCGWVRDKAAAWRRGLQEPADLTPEQVTFARLMTQLNARVIEARLTLVECATQCRAWALMHYDRPALAEDLEAVAASYQRMAAAQEAGVDPVTGEVLA